MTFKIPDFTPNELFFYRNYTFLPLIILSIKWTYFFSFWMIVIIHIQGLSLHCAWMAVLLPICCWGIRTDKSATNGTCTKWKQRIHIIIIFIWKDSSYVIKERFKSPAFKAITLPLKAITLDCF